MVQKGALKFDCRLFASTRVICSQKEWYEEESDTDKIYLRLKKKNETEGPKNVWMTMNLHELFIETQHTEGLLEILKILWMQMAAFFSYA